jgi:hypothetical protein
MQNEKRINGLETQVRTLKRIVCLVCCVFGVFVFTNCSATSKSTDKETLVQDKVEEGKPDHPDHPDHPDKPDHPDHPGN